MASLRQDDENSNNLGEAAGLDASVPPEYPTPRHWRPAETLQKEVVTICNCMASGL
jgi:hypothetical protein